MKYKVYKGYLDDDYSKANPRLIGTHDEKHLAEKFVDDLNRDKKDNYVFFYFEEVEDERSKNK